MRPFAVFSPSSFAAIRPPGRATRKRRAPCCRSPGTPYDGRWNAYGVEADDAPRHRCDGAPGRPILTGARAALQAIGQLDDEEIDLADAAYQLARIDTPPDTWETARAELSTLAREAAQLDIAGNDLLGQAEALAILLAEQHGYRGDRETYDDRANANLIRVIERRLGLPVALGILWLHAARAAGWIGHGLDMPGHFLIALEGGGRRLTLDPFAGGSPVDDEDMRRLVRQVAGADAEPVSHAAAPMTNRAILLRLQNNILVRRLNAGEISGAIACAEDMRRIAPDRAAALGARIAELRARLN